jgi:glycosyltransferase involved in cell wall biosynthesis
VSIPPITYLSMDAMASGIGTSQVAPYIEGLVRRGLDVTVHSFEMDSPSADHRTRFERAGVRWHPHPFGSAGAKGGLVRTLQAAYWCRGVPFLHARADVAAASAILARPERWLWDIRSFWREQRIEIGTLRPGSPEERVLRAVEHRAAYSASVAVALARAAIPVLTDRHGLQMEAKTRVIPTCVDLDRFQPTPFPTQGPLRVLLSGSINRYYDVPAMTKLVRELQRRQDTELLVLAVGKTSWEPELAEAGAARKSVAFEDMPGELAATHVGLSVCRSDLGVSLLAAMPTKIGEFLASGRPVVVNRGLGDMDDLISQWRCGVILDASTPAGIEVAATELLDLLQEPDLPDRCRAAAEATFDLERGLDRLIASYAQAMIDRP